MADATDRRQIEKKLRESEQRLRGLVDSAMDAILAIDEQQRIVLFNAAAEKMFGCFAKDALGTSIDRFIPERFRTEHRAHIRRFGESGVANRALGRLKPLWGMRANGEEFPMEASISHSAAEGKKLFTVIIRDLTEGRQIEEAQRQSEERLHLAVQAGKMYADEWDPAKDVIIRSPECIDILGRDQLLRTSRSDTLAQIHPDDRESYEAFFTGITRDHPTSQVNYRFLRSDGSVVWLEKRARGLFDDKGKLRRAVGVVMDITDRKLAEEALGTVGRRLIEAHEEERTWIARELHDDINQRLALLTIELEQWNQHVPETAADLHSLIQQARKRIFDISKDVQALSHRLHSSKLEYLGITAAASSFCKELSEQYKVRVDFSHSDIPHHLPAEVSLALFRVLQEALQNAVKHSQAPEFRVELRRTLNELHLIVSDSGIGFDQAETMNRRGLGLISMRERLQLVSGHLAVESKPGHGTIVRARVPIKSETDRMSLAG